MSRALTIDNSTHWKSTDILRIVRAARDEGGADPKRRRNVTVRWQTLNASQTDYHFVAQADDSIEISIYLPKRGPKVQHRNALVALAAAGIDADTTMLAVSDSYFLANALAWEFSREMGDPGKTQSLQGMRQSTNPPGWGDGTTLIITKYADPAKDGTYLDYVAKKERAIGAVRIRVDKWETEFERAKRNLAQAKKDLRGHERSLADAKKRRGIS
jgi:hypothetical protein